VLWGVLIMIAALVVTVIFAIYATSTISPGPRQAPRRMYRPARAKLALGIAFIAIGVVGFFLSRHNWFVLISLSAFGLWHSGLPRRVRGAVQRGYGTLRIRWVRWH
jgi:hypothetical protein